MFVKAFILALSLVGVQAFAPMPSSRLAPRSGRKTLVMGTFVEEFKFKRFFNRFTFKTFAECIVASGLESELAGNTIFAPTDAAFEELGAAGLAEIMDNKEALDTMVKFHIIPGNQDGPSFRNDNGKTLTTLQGSALVVDSDGTSAFVDQAKVETYDCITDEGTFHIIDWVNMPKKA